MLPTSAARSMSGILPSRREPEVVDQSGRREPRGDQRAGGRHDPVRRFERRLVDDSPGAGCAGATGRSSSTTRRSSSCSPQGFTPDLGARPLKRAVERHFLTPLALAIAGARLPGRRPVPVRARGQRRPEGHVRRPRRARAGGRRRRPPATLRTLAREGGAGSSCSRRRSRTSRRACRRHLAGRKAELLERMGEPGFWEDEGRIAVLGEDRAARPDRVRAAQRGLAAEPAPRRAPAAGRARPPRRPARCSCSTRRSTRWPRASRPTPCCASTATREFAAARRRDVPAPGRASAACASRSARSAPAAATAGGHGLRLRRAAHARPESGLHVLEMPDGRGGYDRRRVRVTVTPGRRAPPARARRSSAATASARPRSSATPSAAGAPAASTPSWRAAST